VVDPRRPDEDSSNEDMLRRELAALPAPLRTHLESSGFDAERLVRLAVPLIERARRASPSGAAGGAPEPGADDRNRIGGLVEPPRDSDVADAPEQGTPEHGRLAEKGLAALRRGEVALCVLAGGMATRMGGVVKALVEACDGKTFLDLRLAENATWQRRVGTEVPLWLMTSEATEAPVRAALAQSAAPRHVATFMQDVGLRLTRGGRLFRSRASGGDGDPSTYSPGHGDLPDALRRSRLLHDFVARGGRYVWIANLDNLGAAIDAALLGHFIETDRDVMVEVAPKAEGDRGGIPVWADTQSAGEAGKPGATVRRLQVLEEFRLPKGFDASKVRVFNTNTFLVRAGALLDTPVRWSWFEVEKKVDGEVAIQFERLLQELTSAMPATYVRVPREGAASRFLPVKDFDELAKRAADIRAVATARGMT
jgi:UTP--glucose-1-phosphate uridylyltransferase